MSSWSGCVTSAVLLISCCLYGAQIDAQTECFVRCDENLLSIDPQRVLSPGSTLRLETSNPVIEIGLFNETNDFCDSESLQDAHLFVPIAGSLDDEDFFYNSTLDVWIYELECREEIKSLNNAIVDLIIVLSMNAEDQNDSGRSRTNLSPCYTSQEIYWNQNEGT